MKRIMYSLLATTILFASCSKKDNLPSSVNQKRVVKVTQDLGDNTDFTYDSKGRVIKATSGDQEFTYAYNGSTIVEKQRIMSINHTMADITWTLNGKGQAVSGTGSYFIPAGPGQQPQQKSFNITNTFDAAGYRTRMDVTLDNKSGFYEYYYSNGDMVEIKRFEANSFSGKTKFYYPGQVANKINTGTGEYQFIPGLTFHGKVNAHLVEKSEDINTSGAITNTSNHQYTLDAQGYPTQDKINSNFSNTILFYHYN